MVWVIPHCSLDLHFSDSYACVAFIMERENKELVFSQNLFLAGLWAECLTALVLMSTWSSSHCFLNFRDNSCIHSFQQYLLVISYVPGMFLGVEHAAMNESEEERKAIPALIMWYDFKSWLMKRMKRKKRGWKWGRCFYTYSGVFPGCLE